MQRFSEKIVARGNKTEGLTGLFNSSGANTPWLWLDIDRTKCMFHGVQVSDIFNTLQVYLGSYYVNNFNEYGRTWQVNIQADAKFRYDVAAIQQLQVRNSLGSDGPPGHAAGRARHERSGDDHALQHVLGGGRSTPTPRRARVPARRFP